ncbi:hypothetical protein GF420_01315 [candidate division GN15 bacterium]|nr:hypothetical protein [candidate division GN15 bacterium]
MTNDNSRVRCCMAKTPGLSLPSVITMGALFAVILLLVPAAVAQDSQPDDETCLMCHEGYDAGLAVSAHRLSSQMKNPAMTISCVSCHPGAEAHLDDPVAETIGNPARMSTPEQNEICASCHQPHKMTGTVGFDPHIGQDLACTDCHGVHEANVSLLLDEEGEFCGQCHVASVNRFRQRSNHPLTDGNISCISCHDFTGDLEPMVGHGGSVNCAECHQEVAGPFLHEHEAGSSFSTEGDGCIACHRPHGSPNERLLVQPGDNLCQSCHGVPPGHVTAHNGLATSYDCMDCHSAVHGSNDNRSLLDSQLGIKIGDGPGSCYCHNVLD